jgi:hypothetical protein
MARSIVPSAPAEAWSFWPRLPDARLARRCFGAIVVAIVLETLKTLGRH